MEEDVLGLVNGCFVESISPVMVRVREGRLCSGSFSTFRRPIYVNVRPVFGGGSEKLRGDEHVDLAVSVAEDVANRFRDHCASNTDYEVGEVERKGKDYRFRVSTERYEEALRGGS